MAVMVSRIMGAPLRWTKENVALVRERFRRAEEEEDSRLMHTAVSEKARGGEVLVPLLAAMEERDLEDDTCMGILFLVEPLLLPLLCGNSFPALTTLGDLLVIVSPNRFALPSLDSLLS
mmetsp:Transcript_3329/g.8621  ORF Transcript_3329/g.8621 Transcript_3329/m.8621 type:complete len:119 (+) Transcript_3329:708-1064(+)